jgi:23S rRNA pseudouridine1911/1915/1917 synthase
LGRLFHTEKDISTMRLTYLVQTADDGQRAVDVLTRCTGMSRLLAKKIRLYGQLLCNGQPHRMIDCVKAGDVLVANDSNDVIMSSLHNIELKPVPGAQICFQDPWLVIMGKPANLVTHPSYLHEARSLTSLLADQPLHPVNRLDRDTSGVVVIALNGHAHHVLSSHPMQKIYLAVVHGRLPATAGLIQAPIRRAAGSIMLRETHPDGAAARTIWQELHYFRQTNVSLVRFELLTGRTHQIRVHSRSIGCPLLGDGLYGNQEKCDDPASLDRLIGRQALHAASIRFRHPISGQLTRVSARLPDDFIGLMREIYRRERQTV